MFIILLALSLDQRNEIFANDEMPFRAGLSSRKDDLAEISRRVSNFGAREKEIIAAMTSVMVVRTTPGATEDDEYVTYYFAS